MPNWCGNSVTVKGSQSTLSKFMKAVESERSKFDFNKVIPYPEEFRKAETESDNPNLFTKGGYDWCITNWGTKWWVHEIFITVNKGEIIYDFDTAWSPCVPVIEALAKRYPSLWIKIGYEESGWISQVMQFLRVGKPLIGNRADLKIILYQTT